MLVVRCTAKLLRRLKIPPEHLSAPSTTRLGDWYATILPIRPTHLVLLVNESTRLPVVLPAREIGTLAQRIPDAIVSVLRDLGIDPSVVNEERREMTPIEFGKTTSRSVLGTMNEFVFHLRLMREAQSFMTEHAMSMELGRVLVTVPGLGYQQPAELTVRTLQLARVHSTPGKAHTQREPTVKKTASIYELKVTLRDTRPPIWRRLRVRSDITLFKFHSILQFAMGWMDCHLHQFVVRDRYYGVPDPEFPEPRENEKKVLLSQVLEKPKDNLVYEYDFGDGWEHAVVLEQVLEAETRTQYPQVVAGKRACPPEDCGGTGGYEDFLKILADPEHPEHAETLQWAGGSFDPEAFDAGEVNARFRGR